MAQSSEGPAVVIRQHFDPVSSTYTYLVVDPGSRQAVLIDPVLGQHNRDASLIRELELRLLCTLDTHCHADHVTGAWRMKQAFGSRIGLAGVYGASNVDLPLTEGMEVRFGASSLEVRSTPGHTAGCLSFVSADRRFAFTGDALLVRAAGRTDFQQGNAAQLFESVRTQLFTLPDECVVYPAHDYEGRTSSTIGEERRYNPRLGGEARQEDFVGYMENLGLPHPKLLAVAVPANMSCGRTVESETEAPGWGPVLETYAGVPEITPEWLREHRSEVELVDVRSGPEFCGELGHLEGSRLLPLDELRSRVDELASSGKPIVLVCQTGKRSAMAATILRKAGITRVANLAGGMVLWRRLGFPS